MPALEIGGATASDLNNEVKDFSVESQTTDAATDSKFNRFRVKDWSQNLGYYKSIPELKTAIDTKATWTIGAGFEADEATTLLLGTIRGNGKDSFNSILKNDIKVKTLAGASFSEIIVSDNNELINLKPLDPDSIVMVQDKQGIIQWYEQISKVKGKANRKIMPDRMFHLDRDRIADEALGTSVITAVEWIILARNEAMVDWKKVLHLNIHPRWKITLDTDDTEEIAAFKTKYDKANADGENMYIPKGTVEVEVLGIAPNATLNPLAWIDSLNDYFFQAVNVPQIIIGNAKEFTDASGKIVYLAYEQSVKAEQLYIEEQVLLQLNQEINLTFPASLQTDAVSDTPTETDQVEEEPLEEAAQPNDTGEELEGKT